MKIAIVGAGFAGLALAFYLSQKNEVTLFDARGIAAGASGIAAGLLHPYPGRYGKLSLQGHEGMRATKKLLELSSQNRPVFEASGIERFPTPYHPGMWIEEGITVYSRLYLEELWKLCKGAKFIQQKIENLEELSHFDLSFLACGAFIQKFASLPIKTNIGQTLICRWPKRLPHALLGLGHITPTEDPDFCQIGSTYEHTEKPDPKKALELLDKVALFYPPAKDFKVEKILSGVRVSPLQGYLPILEKISDKIYVFTGLGSRGLLYHALLAEEFLKKIENNLA